MKKIISIFALILCVSFCTKADSNQYFLNEEVIEASFNNAEDITSQYLLMLNGGVFNQLGNSNFAEDDKQVTAGIIALASFVVRWGAGFFAWMPVAGWLWIPVAGWFMWAGVAILSIVPWHRLYLKVGGQELKIVALYCVTLGWCINAHHVADGIFLLLDESKSKYINNPKYVMWAN